MWLKELIVCVPMALLEPMKGEITFCIFSFKTEKTQINLIISQSPGRLKTHFNE